MIFSSDEKCEYHDKIFDIRTAGSARTEDGGLSQDAGNIPELDRVISMHSESLQDPSLLSSLKDASLALPDHDSSNRYPDMTSSYLDIAEKIAKNGAGFVTSEVKRLEEALQIEDLDLDAKDNLWLTYNVRTYYL